MEVEAAAASVGTTGAAWACERDFAVWFGLAGAGSESEGDSSSEEEGRSPGEATWRALRAMPASFLALAAARRWSRVWGGLLGSVSEEDEESSSSEEEDEEASGFWRGSWVGERG